MHTGLGLPAQNQNQPKVRGTGWVGHQETHGMSCGPSSMGWTDSVCPQGSPKDLRCLQTVRTEVDLLSVSPPGGCCILDVSHLNLSLDLSVMCFVVALYMDYFITGGKDVWVRFVKYKCVLHVCLQWRKELQKNLYILWLRV